MFGRPIRTHLELLRAPPAISPGSSQYGTGFEIGSPVYVKIYQHNGWRWTRGTIVDTVGRVMYKLKTEEREMIRSHRNQMRRRKVDIGQSAARIRPTVTLDVLLGAYEMPLATETDNAPIANTSHHPPVAPEVSTPSVPLTPVAMGQTTTNHRRNNVQLVHSPRRSSRLRRVPRRFDEYQLN